MAVDDVCLEVARGELMMLVGGSGSGKTTTLKLINRLIEPSGGSVWIDGADTEGLSGPELRRRIGYCFQGVGLFPHLSVRENVGVTPRLLDWAPDAIAERVDALLRLVDLDPQQYGDRAPDALSGGQRQRVGLARALAAKPELMLLDEPFGALDPLIRESLQSAFQELRRELGLTAIFVTHDMVEALLLADRIAVLHAGRLVQVGTPAELLAAPADEHVAALLRTPKRQAQALEEVGGAP
ncbi:MAG: ATP-binding cassette domain-containing protein [Myxococcota bacterium]